MRIMLCGDALFSSRNLAARIDERITTALWEADTAFVNAEFSTPKPTTPPGLCMYLTSVPENRLDELVDLNMNLVSFANNHTIDYGWQGAMETMEAALERDLIPCGIGRNLMEARKARFQDTDNGRVAIVAANATWSERALASMPGADTVARPGQAPLRWSRTYVLPEEQFNQLRAIDEMLGTAKSMIEVSKVETWPLPDENHIKFGSPMEGNLLFEKGDTPGVRTKVNEQDAEELLKSIRDAALRSDAVIATVHTHEGMDESWYNPIPPEFIQKFARDCIDAGADCFLGQGAHFCRGVEVYKGKPIFYNCGSILMEFEAGESMISPEMYNTYYLEANDRPSSLHCNRAKNPDGTWNGFYSERRFSLNYIVEMEGEKGNYSYKIIPIDLDMHRENNLKRGLPEWATEEVGRDFMQRLTDMSSLWGTTFEYDAEDGTISFK